MKLNEKLNYLKNMFGNYVNLERCRQNAEIVKKWKNQLNVVGR